MNRQRSRRPSPRVFRAVNDMRDMRATVRSQAPDKCSQTGKASYRSPASAAGALERIRAVAEPNTRVPIRSYQCDHCGLWHLTSQPLRAQMINVPSRPSVPTPLSLPRPANG